MLLFLLSVQKSSVPIRGGKLSGAQFRYRAGNREKEAGEEPSTLLPDDPADQGGAVDADSALKRLTVIPSGIAAACVIYLTCHRDVLA